MCTRCVYLCTIYVYFLCADFESQIRELFTPQLAEFTITSDDLSSLLESPTHPQVGATADLVTADLLTAKLLTVDLLTVDLLTAVLLTVNLLTANLLTADLVTVNLLNADLLTADLHTADLLTAGVFYSVVLVLLQFSAVLIC